MAHLHRVSGPANAYPLWRRGSACWPGSALAMLCAAGLTAQTWSYPAVSTPYGVSALVFDSVLGRAIAFGRPAGVGPFSGPSQAATWEYDDASHTWEWVETTNPPAAFASYVAAFDGARGRTVLFDGNDTWDYDGTSRIWIQVPSAITPPSRWETAMAYDAARAVTVLFGGYANGGALADTWEFDGSTWRQVVPVTAPPARTAHAMAFNPTTSRIEMFGGENGSLRLGDLWEWDGVTWIARAGLLPSPRSHHALTHCANGMVLFGGEDSVGALNDTWVDWSPVQPTSSPPPAAYGALLASTIGGSPVLLQGRNAFATLTWELNGSSWQPAPRFPTSGWGAMIYDAARDRFVMVGAEGTWEIDPLTGVPVQVVGPAASPFGAMVHDAARGRTVLFDGTTHEYDGSAWTLVNTIGSPSPTSGAASMAYDAARRRTVLLSDGSQTWEYDGATATWSQIPTANLPPGFGTLAYDSGRGRVVCSRNDDGSCSPCFAFTWEYDGVNWSDVTPTTYGGAFAATYDAVRGRTIALDASAVMFSGAAVVMEYDATIGTWLQPPQPQEIGALAFDTRRGRLAMFGNGLWRLQPAPTPTFTRYGVGCAGSAGTPTLDASPGSLPVLGTTFSLQLGNVPSQPGLLLLVLGFDTTAWNGAPLPLTLQGLAMPGCLLWVAPEATALLGTGGGTTASVALAIPGMGSLAGSMVGVQGLALDASSPVLFGAVSNGGILRIY